MSQCGDHIIDHVLTAISSQSCDDKHIMGECAGGGVGAGEAAQVFFLFFF